MSKIFDNDSDTESELKVNNEYAKNYNNWRKKEVLNKLKTKYGEDNLNFDEEGSSTSSSDDEDGVEITEEVEKQFFKTLCCLKTKDPKIYDKDSVFFEEKPSELKKTKPKKDKPVYLNDYERQLILEKNGIPNEEENIELPSSPPRNNADQDILKDIKMSVVEDDDDDDFLAKRKASKSDNEESAKTADYKEWLAGQTDDINDTDIVKDLKPLKDMWGDPKLNPKEKFLRDFILKHRYLEDQDESYIPTYDEIIHDSDENLSHDEEEIAKQEEFEHKYNFRFEEPDQEFIKRYPRTVENSIRQTDDRRKIKRADVKERKKAEKETKMAELKKLQELKRQEIEEKLQKLKQVTANDNVGFKDDDIDGDFDPEEHDRRMQAIFNEEFYQGHEDDQKPEFHDLDEELEIENWDKWDGTDTATDNNDLHCEDEDFNMDADYDPKAAASTDAENDTGKGRRKRKRKSKFAEAISKPKPKFDPNDKNFEEYFEEYYKLDCEDIIGDLPCRFKYRQVLPNNFGLSTEEILLAKDRELNKWCSLKKAVQLRPDHVEKYEQMAYGKKGQNVELKKKILQSLFAPDSENDHNEDNNNLTKNNEDTTEVDNTAKHKKKNKKIDEIQEIKEEEESNPSPTKQKKKKIKKNKTQNSNETDLIIGQHKEESLVNNEETKADTNKNNNTNEESTSTNIKKKTKKKKNKNKDDVKTSAQQDLTINEDNSIKEQKSPEGGTVDKKLMKNKKKTKKTGVNNDANKETLQNRKRKHWESNNDKSSKKMKKKDNNREERNDPIGDISDFRLAAYGLNPKKFKNKLIYKQKV